MIPMSLSFDMTRCPFEMNRYNVNLQINMRNTGQVGMLDDVARRLAGQTYEIKHVEAILLRAKIEVPVQTSFGTMYDRPMESIEKHIEVDKEILQNPMTSPQQRRHVEEELHDLEEYVEHHKEEIEAGDHHDPSPLELYCDQQPGAPECKIHDN